MSYLNHTVEKWYEHGPFEGARMTNVYYIDSTSMCVGPIKTLPQCVDEEEVILVEPYISNHYYYRDLTVGYLFETGKWESLSCHTFNSSPHTQLK